MTAVSWLSETTVKLEASVPAARSREATAGERDGAAHRSRGVHMRAVDSVRSEMLYDTRSMASPVGRCMYAADGPCHSLLPVKPLTSAGYHLGRHLI